MPTSDNFQYKGWRCKAGRAGMTGGYDGTARKGELVLVTPRFWGEGAKARAAEAIRAKIDEREGDKEMSELANRITGNLIGHADAIHTQTHDVVFEYDIEDGHGQYYLLHATDPQNPTSRQTIPIHISVLGKLADVFREIDQSQGGK